VRNAPISWFTNFMRRLNLSLPSPQVLVKAAEKELQQRCKLAAAKDADQAGAAKPASHYTPADLTRRLEAYKAQRAADQADHAHKVSIDQYAQPCHSLFTHCLLDCMHARHRSRPTLTAPWLQCEEWQERLAQEQAAAEERLKQQLAAAEVAKRRCKRQRQPPVDPLAAAKPIEAGDAPTSCTAESQSPPESTAAATASAQMPPTAPQTQPVRHCCHGVYRVEAGCSEGLEWPSQTSHKGGSCCADRSPQAARTRWVRGLLRGLRLPGARADCFTTRGRRCGRGRGSGCSSGVHSQGRCQVQGQGR